MDPSTTSVLRTLPYLPLQDKEIRLLSCKVSPENQECESQLKLEFRLEHFAQTSAPEYYALSYVWGNPLSPRRHVIISGYDVPVTENLYSALVQINGHLHGLQRLLDACSRTSTSSIYLWIDAICLNQDDQLEKAAEVPRMGQIYGQAFYVVVWLGSTPESWRDFSTQKSVIARFIRNANFASLVQSIAGTNGGAQDEARDYSLSTPMDPSIPAMFEVFSYPWFRRVWVMQEIGVAQREPIVMMGPHVFLFETLASLLDYDLGDEDTDRKKPMRIFLAQFKQLTVGISTISRYRRALPEPPPSLAEQLEQFVSQKGARECTLKHDHIYGLLGLLEGGELPTHLRPDYGKPWLEVRREYTKYIFEQTGSLALLAKAQGPRMEDVPSWVSVFRQSVRIPADFVLKHKQANLEFLESGQMVVDGVVVGTIIDATEATNDYSMDGLGSRLCHLAYSITSQSEKILGLAAGSRWSEFVSSHERHLGKKSPFQSQDEFLQAIKTSGKRFATNPVGTTVLRTLSIYGVLLLDNGEIYLFWPSEIPIAKDGSYVMAALVGSLAYSVLQRCSSGEFRLVAQAQQLENYVFMMPDPQDFGEGLFDEHRLQRITIA